MIRRAIAWLAFRLWRWADTDRRLAVPTRELPKARALSLPEPTPDDIVDEALAGRSWAEAFETVSRPHFGPPPIEKPIPPEPMQCAIAKGSEYTVEPLFPSLLLSGSGYKTMRRYTVPYHVVVDGRLACEPSWEPEPSLSTHSVLHVQEHRLCRAPACRALWQPERDRVRGEAHS